MTNTSVVPIHLKMALAAREFDGNFTIEKRKPLCYNNKMHRGFFS